MSDPRSGLRQCRLIALVAVAILALSLVSACGSKNGSQNKKVEFTISSAGLSQVQNAAPSKDYALYVAGNSVPTSAADLLNYTIVQAVEGETVVNRASAVMMGIANGVAGQSGGSINVNLNISSGDGTADGIKKALAGGDSSGGKALVLVKRGSTVPSDAVEIVLK